MLIGRSAANIGLKRHLTAAVDASLSLLETKIDMVPYMPLLQVVVDRVGRAGVSSSAPLSPFLSLILIVCCVLL